MLVGLVVVMFLALAGALGWLLRAQHRAIAKLEQGYLTVAEVDEIIAIQQRLASMEAFATMGAERDAASLLNPHVGLDGLNIGPDVAAWWSDLDEEQKDAIKKHWTPEPETLPSGDLTILRDLLETDHWDRAASGAFATYLDDPADVAWPEAPIPNLVFVQYLAKVRLAKGLVDADMLPALREVRHLARLTLDGEFLVDTMIAIALLSIERQGYEVAVERGILAPGDWEPVSESDTWLARRVAWGMAAVYIGYAPAGSVERLEAAGVPLFGLCSALSESAWIQVAMHEVLGTPWPGEPDFRGGYEMIDARLRTERCSLPMTRMYWERPELKPMKWDEDLRLFLTIPWLRSVTVVELMDMGAQGFVEGGWRKKAPDKR